MAKLLVLDTESGGLDPLTHSLLSIGCVVWEDNKLGPEIEILVREDPFVVTAKALEVNRIDLVEHAAKAVSPTGAQSKLASFVLTHFEAEIRYGTKVPIVAHNPEHDVGFIRRLFRIAETRTPYDTYFSHRKLDTASVLRYLSLTGKVPDTAVSSDGWIQHFGIKVPKSRRHTALGDARATAQLLTKLVGLGTDLP